MIKFNTKELQNLGDALLHYKYDVLGLDDDETSAPWEGIIYTMTKISELIQANEERNVDYILAATKEVLNDMGAKK